MRPGMCALQLPCYTLWHDIFCARTSAMTQSTSGRVSREKRDRIMLIGLDRPAKRNAVDLDMLNDLCMAYGEFERDGEARVALVFAHGEHFTAGLDLASVTASFAAGWQVPAGGCAPLGVSGGPPPPRGGPGPVCPPVLPPAGRSPPVAATPWGCSAAHG